MSSRAKRGIHSPSGPFHPIAEALDLHGYRAVEARQLVAGFLGTWSKRGKGTVVHIITGRGRGSAGRPVLPGLVRRMLETECAALVGRWAPDDNDGGFLVRLK